MVRYFYVDDPPHILVTNINIFFMKTRQNSGPWWDEADIFGQTWAVHATSSGRSESLQEFAHSDWLGFLLHRSSATPVNLSSWGVAPF